MNPKQANDEFGAWFGSLTTDAIRRKGDIPTSVMFVTLTFEKSNRRRQLAEGEPPGSRELAAFNQLYNRVCRTLVGRNYHRAIHHNQFPFALAFLDAEGSRFWRSKGEFQGLHIHSMWVIDRAQVDDFRRCVRETIQYGGDEVRIDGTDVQEIDGGAFHSVDRIACYSSKMIRFNTDDLEVAEDFRVYPKRITYHL